MSSTAPQAQDDGQYLDRSKLTVFEYVGMASGLVLLISLWLPWFNTGPNADSSVGSVGPSSSANAWEAFGIIPWLLLALTYLRMMLLTELITNNAAAMLMLPVVLAITETAGLNDVPYVMAVMMAAPASFATPIGYQCNLMVYGPGGYRFSDFLRIGVPMNLLMALVTIVAIPFIWPLHA